jgi:hypothetical protein
MADHRDGIERTIIVCDEASPERHWNLEHGVEIATRDLPAHHLDTCAVIQLVSG